jgi:hypothetical protein
VTPVLPDEILAMADHPSIINLISALLNSLASVETSGPCIGVISDRGVLIEGLGKSFGADIANHAGSLLVLSTTGAMDHVLLDKLKQLRIIHGKLRGHEAVNLLWGAQLGMR